MQRQETEQRPYYSFLDTSTTSEILDVVNDAKLIISLLMSKSTYCLYLPMAGVLFLLIKKVNSIRCYSCMGTQPGCSADQLDWRLVKNMECSDPHDICVKVTERLFGSELVTRGCLSMLTSIRRDIPSDHYEGCRSAALDVRLHKDVILTHPHQTAFVESDASFCFCGWDNYCNAAHQIRACCTCLVVLLVWVIGFYYNV